MAASTRAVPGSLRPAPAALGGVGQLDLFGEVVAAEQQGHRERQRRHRDALTCLRDTASDALDVVVTLRNPYPRNSRSPRKAGDWVYCVSDAGVWFEATADWGAGAAARGEPYGWDRTPANLVTWDELAALIGDDPRRAEIAAWVETLPDIRWRILMRPYELWPNPGTWHPQYFCRDHVNEHWNGRRRAWDLVQSLLTDAIETLTNSLNRVGISAARE